MTADASAPAVLDVRGISKHYGSVRALNDVSFTVGAGEVVGLVGDNGAGKSTVISIISGAAKPTHGEVFIRGESAPLGQPAGFRMLGVEVVYQDLALGLDLDIADNIFLGREIVRGSGLLAKLGWLDRRRMRSRAADMLTELDLRVPGFSRPVRHLSGGQRQGVAVARASAWAKALLLLDEPTAALGVEQQGEVAAMVKRVAAAGTGVLLISHNMPQVLELCDRVLVLWHGRLVADITGEDLHAEELLRWITGAGLQPGNEVIVDE
jgi:ABC-type sugar transport system ATPase subunit